MLEGMTWQQFQTWVAYSEIEPFGEQRADLRSGIVASLIANVNRGKGSPKFKPEDFMPKFGKSGVSNKRPLTDQAAWNSLKQMAKAAAVTNPPVHPPRKTSGSRRRDS